MTTDRPLPRRRNTPVLALALMAALVSPLASSQTRSNDTRNTSIDDLKEAYLACDRATMSRILAGPEAMVCSVVYEELKRRAFEGDFQKLLAWTRAQPSTRVSSQ